MSNKKERIKRKPEEIRKLIGESGINYVMINNRIFDLYNAGKIDCGLIKKKKEKDSDPDIYVDLDGNEYEYSQKDKKFKTTFNERDFIIFILLNFLDLLDYKGYSVEIADYFGYSDKRVKERLKKLQFIKGDTNSYFRRKTKTRQYFDEDDLQKTGNINFLSEVKEIGNENGKSRIMNRWYVHYGCDYKKEEIEVDGELKSDDVPINFFPVTIYDLDLLTKGLLNEKEFITYLFLIKSYNTAKANTVNYSMRALSKNLGIKNEATTEKYINRLLDLRIKDEFCEVDQDQDFPLIHRQSNKNLQQKLATRNEPSYKYFPIYNTTTMQKLNGQEVSLPYQNSSEELLDTNNVNTDTNILMDSNKIKTDSNNPF